MGDLEHLLILNLTRNQLNGPLSAEFGNLRSIQIMILKNNNIHGPIPVELSDCFSLITLDLSFNNLSGVVPPTRSFQGFHQKGPPKLAVLQMDLKGYTCEDIMRISVNLSEKYIVGYGASSTVYKCVLKNSKAIAIKRLYTQITVGAAQGLAYLHHDCNPRIIHRDVKTSNILVDDNFESRLSDFGIAKCISPSKTHVNTSVLGTIGYIDPEYSRTSRLTEKSDVYSFGIVLLELLTGKEAVDNESNLLQMVLSKADDNTVMEAVDPEVSVTCMDLSLIKKTFQLAQLCTKRHPSERPNMQEVGILSACCS
ncbi:hypothetical protein GIB67_007835 [Kingdonia uniflora]|uniref:non-specific serine/threonine protein kinase n=1 Tax=Kingdonia uniflora TaxID=39325 RepID=A0A7J7N2B1_9MAGN|nr:hypothetical protein GIB67_007835 [Kingdonia uniflora]